MRVDVLTLFPEAFSGPLDVSILKRARHAGLLDLHIHDIREHALDRHRSVDDYPFGGSQGMVLRVDVLVSALEHITALAPAQPKVIYLTPQGRVLNDAMVRRLSAEQRLVLVCGRYEGIDERFVEGWVDEQVSVGDFVLTGGELPAMVLIDAVARHVPGALGDAASAADESFSDGLLEHAQFTRPASFRGRDVPAVLLSGDHAAIDSWRREQRILRTAARRPDLLPDGLSDRSPRKVAGARIRTARFPEDFEAVVAMRDAWPDGHFDAEVPPARDADLHVVAAEGRRMVGAAAAGWDGREGRLYGVFVTEQRRRRGLGSALLEEVEARLVLKGCRTVLALTASMDADAHAFLQRRGWAVEDQAVLARQLPVGG